MTADEYYDLYKAQNYPYDAVVGKTGVELAFDVMVSAGLYFQISRKTGKTKGMLRREARSIVYGEESK